MALIKSANSTRLMKDAIVLDMSDLGRQADQLLSSARAEAARIISQATAEAARLIEQADARGHTAGFERGERAGHEQGRLQGQAEAITQYGTQLESLTQSWTAALTRWETDRATMFHEARTDVIRFADAVARRVVHRQVQVDPTIIQDQLAHALELLGNASAIKITLHPEDRALAEMVLPGLLTRLGSAEHASVQEDAGLTRGGCVLTTGQGRVDASIETQLNRIAEALVPSAPAVAPPDAEATDLGAKDS